MMRKVWILTILVFCIAVAPLGLASAGTPAVVTDLATGNKYVVDILREIRINCTDTDGFGPTVPSTIRLVAITGQQIFLDDYSESIDNETDYVHEYACSSDVLVDGILHPNRAYEFGTMVAV